MDIHRVAIGLCSVVWAGVALAGDMPSVGPAPSWVQPYVGIPEAGPKTDAAIKVLLHDQQLNFTPSGDESYTETITQIQTPQGLAAMGTITLMWNPSTDNMTVHRIQILRGDKTIDALATDDPFTVVRRENNLEYAALDGVLTAVVQPSGLQVGDIVVLAATVHRLDPVLGGISERIVGMPSAEPVVFARLLAQWPSSSHIRWKTSEPSARDVRVERRQGQSALSIRLNNPQPLVQPIGAPIRYRVERRVEFTGFGDWGAVAAKLAPLYESASTVAEGSPLQAEIDRIKAATPDPRARAAAALQLVQDKVRYVFLGMNEGALVPAAADVTWTRRFGDCKAKTALLLGLLRGLDVSAAPVAVSILDGDSLRDRMPMIDAFDHVIVRALIDGRP